MSALPYWFTDEIQNNFNNSGFFNSCFMDGSNAIAVGYDSIPYDSGRLGSIIYWSTNNGLTWEQVGNRAYSEIPQLTSCFIDGSYAIAVGGQTFINGYDSGSGGIYYSTNTGSGFNAWYNISFNNIYTFTSCFIDGSYAIAVGVNYAQTNGIIYTSTNTGNGFTSWAPAASGDFSQSSSLVSCYMDGSYAIAVGQNYAQTNGIIYFSIDRGQNWSESAGDFSYTSNFTGPFGFSSNDYFPYSPFCFIDGSYAIALGQNYAQTNGIIYYSIDSGSTWSKSTSNFSDSYALLSCFIEGPNAIAVGLNSATVTSYGIIYYSKNTGSGFTSWAPAASGDFSQSSSLVSCYMDGSYAIAVGATPQTSPSSTSTNTNGIVYFSIDGGQIWNKDKSNFSISGVFNTCFVDGSYAIMCGQKEKYNSAGLPIGVIYSSIYQGPIMSVVPNTPSGKQNPVYLPLITTDVSTNEIVQIDWGDTGINQYTIPCTFQNHTYGIGSGGPTFTISVGTTNYDNNIIFSSQTNPINNTLTEVVSFGNYTQATFAYAFYNCITLTTVPSQIPSSVTDLSSMFQGASVFNQSLNDWNVYNVTSMASMFQGATSFNANINDWNVYNVISMSSMFQDATAFNQQLNTNEGYNTWNVTNVTNMASMFQGATAFNQPLNNWNVPNVTSMASMFQGATSFNELLFTSFESITDMSSMFNGAVVFNQAIISNWDVSGVSNMSSMFQNAVLFNQALDNWQVNDVTNMANMFNGARTFNQNISNWDISNVKNTSGMFQGAQSFNNNYNPFNPKNTGNINDMSYMFSGATSFNQDISAMDFSGVKDMTHMLSNSGLSSTNYHKFLIGLSKQSVNRGVRLDADNIVYTSAAAALARKKLIKEFGWTIQGDIYKPDNIVCFKENTKILTDIGYVYVQNLKKGTLVKTLYHGFKPIHAIGTKIVDHVALDERIPNQLYKCCAQNYPTLFEDLVITGRHSILVNNFISDEEREKTREVNSEIYKTDDKFRLPACVDKRSKVYETAGSYTIYHFALENDNNYGNYGVYANGLLVESCSKKYLIDFSEMKIL